MQAPHSPSPQPMPVDPGQDHRSRRPASPSPTTRPTRSSPTATRTRWTCCSCSCCRRRTSSTPPRAPPTGGPGSTPPPPSSPVHVVWANLIPNEPERWLRVAYYQSTIEGCARPGSEELQLDGRDILVRVTLMQPPATAWAIPCDEEVVELDTVLHITTPLEPGHTYRVIVNDRETTTFAPPGPDLRDTFIAESPIEGAEIVVSASTPVALRAARRLRDAHGQQLLPVQRLRDPARGIEPDRCPDHPPPGRRPRTPSARRTTPSSRAPSPSAPTSSPASSTPSSSTRTPPSRSSPLRPECVIRVSPVARRIDRNRAPA